MEACRLIGSLQRVAGAGDIDIGDMAGLVGLGEPGIEKGALRKRRELPAADRGPARLDIVRDGGRAALLADAAARRWPSPRRWMECC